MLSRHIDAFNDNSLVIREDTKHASAPPLSSIRLSLLFLGREALDFLWRELGLAIFSRPDENLVSSFDMHFPSHFRSPPARARQCA